MWVRSQDKRILGDYHLFTIPMSVGSKKRHITGKRSYDGFFGSNDDILGQYESLERATEELNNLQEAMISDPQGIYDMK